MSLRATGKNNKGFTLLEVLVAVGVLVIVALPLLSLFVYNTRLVRNAETINDTTYLAQSVMEDLQPLGYTALYGLAPAPGAKGNYQIKSVMNSSTVYVARQVSIDRLPYGSFNSLVTGTACYAHIVFNGNTATFTGPDGVMRSGISLSGSSYAVTMTATTIRFGSGSTWNLNIPSGSKLILIINAGANAITPAVTITLPSGGSVPYVLYALSPDDSVKQAITVANGSTNSKEYRKYASSGDPPPAYMLVNALVKVYKADNVTLDSVFQNTLRVNLP